MPTASCSSICWPNSAPANSVTSGCCAFLRDGDIASLEIGLALHARLEPNQVRHLLYHADRRHLAALCIAAGFATPHYITLRMALEIAEEAMAPARRTSGYSSETIRFLQVQYERLRGRRGQAAAAARQLNSAASAAPSMDAWAAETIERLLHGRHFIYCHQIVEAAISYVA